MFDQCAASLRVIRDMAIRQLRDRAQIGYSQFVQALLMLSIGLNTWLDHSYTSLPTSAKWLREFCLYRSYVLLPYFSRRDPDFAAQHGTRFHREVSTAHTFIC